MEPFLASDDSDALIDGQMIEFTNLPIGAELEFPVETAWGEVLFRPGLRFVASNSSGGGFAGEACKEAGPRSRGRIDFGIDYMLDDDLVLGFGSFYSGLGRKDLEIYGAGLDLRSEF